MTPPRPLLNVCDIVTGAGVGVHYREQVPGQDFAVRLHWDTGEVEVGSDAVITLFDDGTMHVSNCAVDCGGPSLAGAGGLRHQRARSVPDVQPVRRAAALRPGGVMVSDWTADASGASNSSPQFLEVVEQVERLIRGDAHALIQGRADKTARLIVANLAHLYGMAPNLDAVVDAVHGPGAAAAIDRAYASGELFNESGP